MSDYTFHKSIELLKNNNTIQTILDIDALAGAAKAAVAGYIASLNLPPEQTQHLLWENIGIGVLVQQLTLVYYLPSLGSQTPAPALKRTSTLQEKVIEMQGLESKFPKCQILIFGKNAGETNWIWLNTETIQNSGDRVNTLKLVPYISQSDAFIPGRGSQIGLQFIEDPVSKATLPQSGDRVTVSASVAMDVNPISDTDSKKNNDQVDQDEVAQLNSRLAVIETLLQPFGAATATTAGTTGLVTGAAAGEEEFLLKGNRTWQNPAAFVRMIGEQIVAGVKTFVDTITCNKLIRSVGIGALGGLSSQSQAAIFAAGGGGYLSLISAAAPTDRKIIDFGMTADGVLNIRRVNDSYTSVVSTLQQFDAENNLKLFNFSYLGANVAIKILLVEGFTAASQGNTTNLALGINGAKIRGYLPQVDHTVAGKMKPGFTRLAGYEYQCFIDNDSIAFMLSGTNSANILNKPCSCLVIYTK